MEIMDQLPFDERLAMHISKSTGTFTVRLYGSFFYLLNEATDVSRASLDVPFGSDIAAYVILYTHGGGTFEVRFSSREVTPAGHFYLWGLTILMILDIALLIYYSMKLQNPPKADACDSRKRDSQQKAKGDKD
jgi:hypothetical protein